MKFYDLNKTIWQWITLLFLAVIWGSSFILMKKGLIVYSHNVVAALRISLASIVLIPFAFKAFKKVESKDWKYLIFAGIIGNGIPAFLFTFAQTEVSSSLTGMLNSLVPIFSLILGVILFKSKPLKTQIIGIFIGLIGACGLIFSNGLPTENSNFAFTLLIVAATICYALSVNVIKTYLKEIKAIHITALSFISIGPFTIIYLFTTNFIEVTTTNAQSFNALIYIGILAILGTALAIIVFNMLIKTTTTVFATSVTYLIPIVAIFWGIFDGETMNISQVFSATITLIGIYFINKR
ncbi:DMT family transporter [Vicingaceae bacterium]|jgi:drug/metabolite transporter (DMT)-like permease|nr:DMT family transporter [Vicingaceae bacterium]